MRIDLISIGLDNENLSGMYIRVTTNSKGAAYYHLVESYRDQGKVRQRTLLSLGRVEDGKLEQLAEAISKHTDKISVFNMAKDVDVKDTYILGPLLVLERMMAVYQHENPAHGMRRFGNLPPETRTGVFQTTGF